MSPILLSWSSGKDCAMALQELLIGELTGRYEVVALLTTVTRDYERVSMHGVRRSLLEAQAASLGLPLEVVEIPAGGDNASYEAAMSELLLRYRAAGVRRVAFGDLFLADIRAYREQQLARVGMQGLFPLWGRETAMLAREVQRAGFRAVVTCVDTERLAPEFAGRDYDAAFLADLPEGVDPCGENGEFHTFVWNGPIFREPVRFTRGERVRREGRWEFCDLRGQGPGIGGERPRMGTTEGEGEGEGTGKGESPLTPGL